MKTNKTQNGLVFGIIFGVVLLLLIKNWSVLASTNLFIQTNIIAKINAISGYPTWLKTYTDYILFGLAGLILGYYIEKK